MTFKTASHEFELLQIYKSWGFSYKELEKQRYESKYSTNMQF